MPSQARPQQRKGRLVFGADSQALRLLAGKLEQISGRLSTIESNVNGRVESMAWTGGDATNFKNAWTGTSAPSIRDASRTLNDAAGAIRGDAQRQEQISGI